MEHTRRSTYRATLRWQRSTSSRCRTCRTPRQAPAFCQRASKMGAHWKTEHSEPITNKTYYAEVFIE